MEESRRPSITHLRLPQNRTEVLSRFRPRGKGTFLNSILSSAMAMRWHPYFGLVFSASFRDLVLKSGLRADNQFDYDRTARWAVMFWDVGGHLEDH